MNDILLVMIIEGKNVILRPIEYSDTALIVKWRNTQSVSDNFVFREKFTEEMHTNWMKTKVDTGEVVQYIIVEKNSGLPVGSVYFRDINNDYRSAEYGIFIGEECARGKGYGSETAKLFVDFGFKELKLHRIFLRVFEHNARAIKSYEKAGFVIEGKFRDMVYIDGEYHNMIFMSVIKDYEDGDK